MHSLHYATFYFIINYKQQRKVCLPGADLLCITNDSSAVRDNHIKCWSKRKILESQALRHEKLFQINHPSTSVSLQLLS